MINNIALNIDAQKEQAILQKIEELKALLPEGLISLTEHEKHSMVKLGDKTVAFVEKSIDSAAQNPAVLPSYVELNGLKKDFGTFISVSHIIRALNQVSGSLEDSAIMLGHDSYTASLSIYHAAKDAARRDVPGAKQIVDDLSVRFPGRGKKAEEKNSKQNSPQIS